jgi:multiple sugar transport system substrate-binding protein
MPLTINRAELERDHLPMAKFDWNWDEFLQWCLAVKQVDKQGRTTRFAVMPFGADRLWQTNGASMFNETMTRCTLDSARALEATEFYYDLMFKYNVMPTPVDQQAAAQAGYGGLTLQWLGQGKALAVSVGRYGQIQLRRFPDFVPDVALIPYKVMPMVTVSARAAAVNAVSRHPKLAARFLQFLTSQAYNDSIVAGADALPPSPVAARSAAFVHPQDYPSEADANVKYRRAAEEYGVSGEYSPFVSPIIVQQINTKYFQGVESQVLTPKQAMLGMSQEINAEMQRNLGRDPQLHDAYEKALRRQQQIDALKAQGKPVPLDWIDDPVLRRLREGGK